MEAISEFTELIPDLPEELGLECMTRLPYSAHRVASRVCRKWSELIKSKDFYYRRKQQNQTHQLACLVQAVIINNNNDDDDGINSPEPTPSSSLSDDQKPSEKPSYWITVFDPVSRSWDRIDPIPKYPNGLPLFCQMASSEGKLVVLGGWDPVSYDPVTTVFVYDFTLQAWRQGKDMPAKRSFFAAGAVSGKVYVAGGHDESKNALKTGWVYDVDTDEWSDSGLMSRERDECEGVVVGNEFWVVSGYGTDRQGVFDDSADVFELESGTWRLVEGVWVAGKCPRSSVGVGTDGKLVSWADLDANVQVGSCGITVDNRVVVTGSEYQGAPQAFYVMEMGGGRNGKLEKVTVPDEFSGFVQSGCCVEI